MWRQLGWWTGVSTAVCLLTPAAAAQSAGAMPDAPPPATAPPPAATAGAPESTGSATPAPTSSPAPASSPAPDASVQACFPSCRSGFTCHRGQCVSLCNPPCGQGERCLLSGECEREHAFQPQERAAPAASNEILRPAGSFAFAARAGLQFAGGGHVESRCSSSDALFSCSPKTETDFDERSYATLGLDALVHAAPALRLGVNYQLVPYSGVEADRASEVDHLGHEHALSAVLEGLIALAPKLALALRAQAGGRALFVGGDLAESADEFLAFCAQTPDAHCEVDHGPLFGASYGALVGFVGGGRVRWRVDIAVDRLSLRLPDNSQSVGQRSISTEATLYATRSWVTGGVEF